MERYTTIMVMCGCLFQAGAPVGAQIVRDGSLGAGGVGSLAGPNFMIPGDLGQTVCNEAKTSCNVFHSFSQFNVNTGESATFTGPTGIDPAYVTAVLARVTGPSLSNIDGLLTTAGLENADFFLMNPNGVVFGPNAQLDVGGSFLVTTANEMHLADGGKLTTTVDPDNSVLTVAAPSAFGFLPTADPSTPVETDSGNSVKATQPAGVDVNQATLEVSQGEVLSVVSGDIRVTNGTIAAPRGRVNIVSIASPGTVELDATDLDTAVDVDSFTALGAIDLTDASVIDVSGDGGGRLEIRGGHLEMTGSSLWAQTLDDGDGWGVDIRVTDRLDLIQSRIDTRSNGRGSAGGVMIFAHTVVMDGRGSDASTGIFTDSLAQPIPSTADLSVTVDITHTFDADVDAVLESPFGARVQLIRGIGGGGDDFTDTTLDDRAVNPVALGSPPFTGIFQPLEPLSAFIDEVADGVWVLELDDTFPAADDGVLNSWSLNVGELVFESSGVGQVFDGSMAIRSELSVDSPGLIVSATAEVTPGGSGGVRVKAHDLTVFQARISSENRGAVQGGDVDIQLTGQLAVTDGSIDTSSFFTGPAGDIVIDAGGIELLGDDAVGAFVRSQTAGSGRGGDVSVRASQIEMTGLAQIATTSFSSGRGGDISVTADRLVMNGAGVDTEALFVIDNFALIEELVGFRLSDIELALTASVNAVSNGSGDGGDLTINVDTIDLMESATLATTTFGQGDGGKITVEVDTLFAEQGSSRFHSGLLSGTVSKVDGGDAGDIEINAGSILFKSGGMIATDTVGPGQGGDLAVTADRIELDGSGALRVSGFFVQSTSPEALGDVGEMTLNVTGDLIVRMAGLSTTNQGVGASGPIEVNADRVIVDGNGIFSIITALTNGSRMGGQIEINASDVRLIDRGVITSATLGTADAGAVVIETGAITLDGGNPNIRLDRPLLITGVSTQAALNATGDAGDIRVQSRGPVILRNNATITTSARVSDGGLIDLSVGTHIVLTDSTVSAAAGADGGNIKLTAPDRVELLRSTLTARAGNNGAQIEIDPRFVIFRDSVIDGRAGGEPVKVIIDSMANFLSSNSQILTSAVSLPPELDIAASLVTLPGSLLAGQAQLPPHCAALFAHDASSFTVHRWGAAAIEPGGWLPSFGRTASSKIPMISPVGGYGLDDQ